MSSLSKSFRFTPILGGGLGTSNKVGKAPGINVFFLGLGKHFIFEMGAAYSDIPVQIPGIFLHKIVSSRIYRPSL